MSQIFVINIYLYGWEVTESWIGPFTFISFKADKKNSTELWALKILQNSQSKYK
jgi:hypothetical protein